MTPTPTIIPRSEHCISRAQLNPHALKVLYGLHDAGFQAYMVGGGVRDLLLGREPKDFDVATNATPEQVQAIFRNCRLIGRRFRLAHVHFGRDIIEVATFRGNSVASGTTTGEEKIQASNGMILRDNLFGTIEEDALRRDLTINALYYNIADFSVVDYVQGIADLKHGLIRLIGNPEQRYHEDPVRILRAIRFAAKLAFAIEAATEEPLSLLSPLLLQVPAARLFEEVLKMFHGGFGAEAFSRLRQYGIFDMLFPETAHCLQKDQEGMPNTLIMQALSNTDDRILNSKGVNPAFLFAVLLWPPIHALSKKHIEKGMLEHEAVNKAEHQIVNKAVQLVAIPKRLTVQMYEIWDMQRRLQRVPTRRPGKLASQPRFRAAYDFLVLRARAGEIDPAVADWWTAYQEHRPSADEQPPVAENTDELARKPRRRRRRRPPTSTETTTTS